MQYVRKIIKIRDLMENYENDNVTVTTMNGHLNIRPAYQRNYVYNDTQRKAVIRTLMEGSMLGYLQFGCQPEDEKYIDLTENGNKIFKDDVALPNRTILEMGDGQQRTISIGDFLDGVYSYTFTQFGKNEPKKFYGMTPKQQEQILGHDIDIMICIGTPEEQLENFRRVNTNGEPLNEQEMRNAAYTGTWLADAKARFSNGNFESNIWGTYTEDDCNRQKFLEYILKSVSGKEGISINEYMAKHQNDKNASELGEYFDGLQKWVETLFAPLVEEGYAKKKGWWSERYNKYCDVYTTPFDYDEINKLIGDEEIEDKSSIIPYLLEGHDKKYLNRRIFSSGQKSEVWRRQGKNCKCCGKPIDKIKDAVAHHIIPWDKGGKTENTNCAILHKKCHIDLHEGVATLMEA